MQESTVRRQGNSVIIGIPKEIVRALNWKEGDTVALIVKDVPLGVLGTQKILEVEKLVRPRDLANTTK
jgi:AbrB family looped-hinge helix DNA binding protein